ncbi:MAG: gliding motility-associated C-terminal domain-containing protein [Bacteroidota bacterium]
MNRLVYLYLFFLCLPTSFYAQEICNNNIDDDNDGQVDLADCDCFSKRGNSWHFGAGAGVDFNTNPPTIFQSAMRSPEGGSSICDEDGNLLFYSNGGGRQPMPGENPGIIWERDGAIMYDMMGTQGGGYSATNSCVIVKKPNSTTNYYMFTMEEFEFDVDGNIPGQPQGRGLSYFEIDMSANGGDGAVVLADQRLYVPTYEFMAAIEHDNGEDYWIIIVRDGAFQNREFVVFAATEDGVEQAGSYLFPSALDEFFFYVKASPTRRQISEWSTQSVVFTDFDPATGVLSSRTRIPQGRFIGGEYSPSGRYFYYLQEEQVGAPERTFIRLDLSTLASGGVFEEVGSYTLNEPVIAAPFQLGPNNAIYFRDVAGFLGAITCPDGPNPTVDPEFIAIDEVPNTIFSGFASSIPNYPNHYFFRPSDPLTISGATNYSICATDSVTLSVQTNKCADLLWSTGATTSSITVTEVGTYTLTATDGCESAEFEIVVSPEGLDPIVVEAPSGVCRGALATLLPVDVPAGVQTEWQTTDGQLISDATSLSIEVTQDTVLVASFTVACGTTQTTVTIEALEEPTPNLSLTDAGCTTPTGTAALLSPDPNWTINWLDGSANLLGTAATLDNLMPGEYAVVVSNTFGTGECAATLPFTIQEVPLLTIGDVQVVNNSCPDEQNGILEVLSILGEGPFTTAWLSANTGQVLGTAALVENLADGTYLLRVTDDLDCTVEEAYEISTLPQPDISASAISAFCDNPNGAILIGNPSDALLQLALNGQVVEPSGLLDLLPAVYELVIQSEEDCLLLDTLLLVENTIDTGLSGQLMLSSFANRPLPIDLGLTDFSDLTIEWSPSGSLSCANCPDPVAQLRESTMLQATLTDTITGCTGIYEIDITIRPEEKIYIPNAFSPNDDGVNDFFEVFTSDQEVLVLTMQVYDRWGALVFEQSGANRWWDGTFNGSDLPSGVYVYVVQVQLSTGRELLSGDVALVR